jgi:hypothetical protein
MTDFNEFRNFYDFIRIGFFETFGSLRSAKPLASEHPLVDMPRVRAYDAALFGVYPSHRFGWREQMPR